MKELSGWSVFTSPYSDNKIAQAVLHLRLVDTHSREKTTTNIVFDVDDIQVIDEIINKQLIPCLKGEPIKRGDYAVEEVEMKHREKISEMTHYG